MQHTHNRSSVTGSWWLPDFSLLLEPLKRVNLPIGTCSKHFVPTEAVTPLQPKPPVTTATAEEMALLLNMWRLSSHLGVGAEAKRKHIRSPRPPPPGSTGPVSWLPGWGPRNNRSPTDYTSLALFTQFMPLLSSPWFPHRCRPFSLQHPQKVTCETPGQSGVRMEGWGCR